MADAIALLECGDVTKIILDHDLGYVESGCGYDVVCWMEEAIALRGFIVPEDLAAAPSTDETPVPLNPQAPF